MSRILTLETEKEVFSERKNENMRKDIEAKRNGINTENFLLYDYSHCDET